MAIRKSLRSHNISCILLLYCALLLTFTSIVYGDDDWILIESYDNFTTYYNSKLLKIDAQNNIITVWMRGVFGEKGINDLIKSHIKDKIIADEIKNIHDQTILYEFNYKKWQYSINHITLYSNSGNILMDWAIPPEWRSIVSDSNFDGILKELLVKYDLKR